jgi:DNA-binding MarR family transcriptional regulator
MARPNAAAKIDDASASDLEDLIGYNLKRAYVAVQTDFQRVQGEDGLSGRVFSALSLTVQHPQITQSALARMLGIERSGLVAIVDELEGKGYLTRVAVPSDRRVQALVPTDLGRDAYSTALAAVRAHEDRVFANLTDTERATLLALLKRVREGETDT